MRTLGSSGSEGSTPEKTATAASIFTEQSNLVSKFKRFEQKYRMALEQKVRDLLMMRQEWLCVRLGDRLIQAFMISRGLVCEMPEDSTSCEECGLWHKLHVKLITCLLSVAFCLDLVQKMYIYLAVPLLSV